MYGLLASKFNSQNYEDSQIAYDFNEFWSKELHHEKWQRKKLGCLNILILYTPWNEGLQVFEVGFQQSNFKTLYLFLLTLKGLEGSPNSLNCQKLL
jgi:hypothetical protein